MSPILLFCTAGIRDRPFERQAPRGRVLSEVGRRLLVRFLAALVTLCFGCAAAGKARVSGKCFRGGRYMPVLLYAVFVAGNTVDFYAMGDLRKCWHGVIVLSCFYIYALDVYRVRRVIRETHAIRDVLFSYSKVWVTRVMSQPSLIMNYRLL